LSAFVFQPFKSDQTYPILMNSGNGFLPIDYGILTQCVC